MNCIDVGDIICCRLHAHIYMRLCMRLSACCRLCVVVCGTVRTSVDKVEIVEFRCGYADSTFKQIERERGKRGMVKRGVLVHERERDSVCGKRG